jgi:branched-chain amino acid transport system substrate-binding protein
MVSKILWMFICSVITVFPQYSSDNITTEFQIGINLFQSYQNKDALDVFTRISNQEFNHRTTASLLFEGKINLLISSEQEALDAFDKLFLQYPSSRYIDEAHMCLAEYYLDRTMYVQSLRELCLLILNTKSPHYDSLARTLGEKICLRHLDNTNLDTLLSALTIPKDRTYLLLLKSKLNLSQNDRQRAKECLSEIVSNYPDCHEEHMASALLADLNVTDENNGNLIGVILPVYKNYKDSSFTEPSMEILEGIKFAVSEYNNVNADKIGLLIKDTQNNAEKIKDIKKEFDKVKSLKAIIGPVFSDEVKAALEIFRDTNIPLISPTATENDLSAIYPNFFQANPSFILRGKIMAQYIYFVENKKKMAVLSAGEKDASSLAKAFKEEFIRLGGKIILEVTYASKSYDLNSQITKIKSRIKDIEGLYIPLADKTVVPVILSQLEQHSINLTLYGNQEWLLAKGFESSSNLSNQLILTSDYFIDYDDLNFQSFNKSFHQKTGMDANRNVLYGYDAARFVLASFKNETPDRNTIKATMESGVIFKGFHNNISFGSERVNKFLNIIRYKDGKFQLVDKFSVGE